MLNLMRADVYRLLRGRAVYISLVVIVLLVGLVVFVFRMAPATGIVTDQDVFEPVAQNEMTAAMGARLALGAMNNMAYVFLAGIIVTVAAAFSSGAVKNEISIGISRTKYYISKWLLSCAIGITTVAVCLALSIVFASFVDGFGYWGDGFLAEVLTSLGLQTILAMGLSSVGVFLCFITRKSGAALGLYIAFNLVPMFIIVLLDSAFPWAMDLAMYDMSFLFGVFAQSAAFPMADIVRGAAVAISYTIVSTIAGVMLFRKAEIK